MENMPRYLVIDEIGPLELSGRGLEPMVSTILENYERSPKQHLVLVVRDYLLEKVISHYHLRDQILTDHNFLRT
jgi:nucleoside-triphosphatase THEP1